MASNPVSRLVPATGRVKLIGELLHDAGRLTDHDIRRVIAEQRQSGRRFGETAHDLGMIDEDDIRNALARQFHYDYIRPSETQLSADIFVASDLFGPATEAVRGLRGELMLRWFDADHRCLAVGGASRASRASLVAANLAVAFAQLGKRTLLVDADLRRPRQHELFGLSHDTGLADLLIERCAMTEAIVRVAAFDLSVLGAGTIPLNPHELLSSGQFGHVLETARMHFEIVIVDSAPLLECAEAQMVALRSEGYLFATRRHRTRLADIEAARTRLQPSGATVLGAVISD